ncbi:MAG: endonuclease III [Nitrospirae bacterium GWC2_42_7]|nr:MAG: endonuclease III [Nitrospirae bacterium GWC2_42_7]
MIKRLQKEYTDVRTALNYNSPFELLAATILSAQSTDIHINKVTESLFKKYRYINDYADTPLEELKKDLSSVNFYNNKAKNIQASAKIIIEKFNARVPARMDELITLPGVARKTANIVLSEAFGINEGIAVDTHVKRLSYRLGLSKNEDPVKIEKDLMAITPKKEWSRLSHLLIFHGRKVCQAKKPDHKNCVLDNICPSRNI